MSSRIRACLSVAVATMGLAASVPAMAEQGFYVGGSAGEAIYHEDKSDFDTAMVDAFSANGLSLSSGGYSTLDKADIAFSGILGYRFMPGLAVEAAYVDLGKLNYKFTGTVFGFPTNSAKATLSGKVKGPTLSALGILPFGSAWEAYGRFGLFFSKTTLSADISLDATSTSGGGSGHSSESANAVDGLVGAGLAWHVGGGFSLRAEYIRYINVGDKDKTGEINIDNFNIGVIYSFH